MMKREDDEERRKNQEERIKQGQDWFLDYSTERKPDCGVDYLKTLISRSSHPLVGAKHLACHLVQ
jgi:hypothetical protein